MHATRSVRAATGIVAGLLGATVMVPAATAQATSTQSDPSRGSTTPAPTAQKWRVVGTWVGTQYGGGRVVVKLHWRKGRLRGSQRASDLGSVFCRARLNQIRRLRHGWSLRIRSAPGSVCHGPRVHISRFGKRLEYNWSDGYSTVLHRRH